MDNRPVATFLSEYLDPSDRDALPKAAVLLDMADGAMRTIVLDRRVGREFWEDIGRDIGLSTPAARQRYVRPAPARSVLGTYTDRDAYYLDGRQELGEAWGWQRGDRSRGWAPYGADEGVVVVEDGTRWLLTISAHPITLRSNFYRRLGVDGSWKEVDLTATAAADAFSPEVVLVARAPLGTTLRALATVPRRAELEQVAGAVADELDHEQRGPFWPEEQKR